MARRSDREDPVSQIRRLLRAVRGSPHSQDRIALRGAVEIALFRLPSRQQTILRRYDLGGEGASEVEHDLGLSPRQFFRDRRKGLALLSGYVFEPERLPSTSNTPGASETRRDASIAARTFARSLAQAGDARCLDVLSDLAAGARNSADRADILLELAQTATDCSDQVAAATAAAEASRLLSESCDAQATLLRGGLAHVRGRLAKSQSDALLLIAQALTMLRTSFANNGNTPAAAAALADALGDAALLHFSLGAYAQARAASLEAIGLIETYALQRRPKAVEILAMHAAIEACVSGRTRTAIADVTSLLHVAIDSGWSSTACRLGADLVGLNAICGDYDEAIRWYEHIMPLAHGGARPSDRANLAMEAAHSYTMRGRASEALAILGYARPENGCPCNEVPSWHAVAGTALANLGNDGAAIAEAHAALSGYSERGVARGVGDAHHLLAICYAHRGDARRARDHIVEARRLIERYGVPYALLLTLVSEAAIVRTASASTEAIEYKRLLQRLACS